MPATCSISMVGDKIVVGALDVSFLGPAVPIIPGTCVFNGPTFMGLCKPVPTAGVMIGPPMNVPTPASLEVTGIANYFGVLNVIAVSNFTGLCTKNGLTVRNSASITNGVNNKNGLNVGNAPSTFNGLVTVQGKLLVTGVISCARIISPWLSAQLAQGRALPGKSFDIVHPTKGKGHRLRYGCLEGPELGVYVRGVLQGTNEIELPDYWKDLVDEDTITVQLTPIGSHQSLCYAVAKMKDKVSILVNPHGFNVHTIHCSYIVHGTRKDLDPMIVEYEGETPDAYPGQDYLGVKRISESVE